MEEKKIYLKDEKSGMSSEKRMSDRGSPRSRHNSHSDKARSERTHSGDRERPVKKSPGVFNQEIVRAKQEQGEARTYTRKLDEKGRGYGTGRGKGTAVARVWVSSSKKGKASFIVNNQKADEYFPREFWMNELYKPIKAVLMDDTSDFDVKCTASGGGLSGQVRAIKLGLARALIILNPNMKEVLKEAKLLTSDSRIKEREKYGQRGARAKFPYNRR